jgi:hypothetical protein
VSIITFVKGWFGHQERVLTDIALSDLDLINAPYRQQISRTVGTRPRMDALAAQFNVTPALIDADRGLAMELGEACSQCKFTKACQNSLDLGVDFDASRCPNATIFQDMSPI